MNKRIYPLVEAFETDSLGTGYKGFAVRVEKGISKDKICECSWLVAAQFFQYQCIVHIGFLIKTLAGTISWISVDIVRS